MYKLKLVSINKASVYVKINILNIFLGLSYLKIIIYNINY